MNWWTGKAEIAVCILGDSNIVALGSTPGVQTDNPNVFCYASASGQTPYSEGNLGWYNLSNDATSRVAEFVSYSTLVPNTGFVGQLLDGNGAPGMQLGNTLQEGAGADVYVYQVASPGMTSAQFSSGDCWDTVVRTAQAALDSIPGDHAYFDVFVTNLGGNDLLSAVTDENYFLNMALLRQKMIAAGWWVSGITQAMILEMPRIPALADYPDVWLGHDFFLDRLNDTNGRASSTGLTVNPDDPIPVHFVPESNTELGRRAGELLLAGLPKPEICGFWDDFGFTALALRTRGEIRGAMSGGLVMSGGVSSGSYTRGRVEIR